MTAKEKLLESVARFDKRYNRTETISFEIAGDIAMFKMPQTLMAPKSYPAPPYSAVLGICKAIYWHPFIRIRPYRTEICSPIKYEHFYTNHSQGPAITSAGGRNFQRKETALTNVCYKIYATVEPVTTDQFDSLEEKHLKFLDGLLQEISPALWFKNTFDNLVKYGKTYKSLFLGKYYCCNITYFGPLRKETSPCYDINKEICSMVYEVYPNDRYNDVPYKYYMDINEETGKIVRRKIISSTFLQNVKIVHGVLEYPRSAD